jgi:Zn-dependent protease with chaperone function
MAEHANDAGFEFPDKPAVVPADLTRPTSAYKLHAWLAMLALLVFVSVYGVLTGYFCLTAFRMIRGVIAGGPKLVVGVITAIPATFFAVFLVKGLLFVKRGDADGLIEVTEAEEPRLFAFLRRIATETGAPQPHKVFLAPNVNAAVFYDISLLNLLLPTRKNLVIGLGLINVLSASELKAVLAHEFGHFAQRTMAVGRWVYISGQVAAAIVANRDALDRMLIGLSRVDIRIAWIGWLMRIVVWAIRAVLETAFGLVVLAERALSKEMEFNADLVSVSVAGSDALVHALHKLQAADEAWDQAVGFLANERARGKATTDAFEVQRRFLERVREVLADEHYGQVPALPDTEPQAHRVFEAALGQPPRMWSTHPPNHEREANAKRHYIAATLYEASAWGVLVNSDQRRREVTLDLLRRLGEEDGEALPEAVPLDESLSAVDEQFARASLDRRYHGVYLGRSPVRNCQGLDEAFAPLPSGEAAVQAALDALYPEELGDEVTTYRELHEEHGMLEALRDGFLDAPGGVIHHRGRMLRRKELDEVVSSVDDERDQARRRLCDHDRACRTAHRAAARDIGGGWDAYHRSLVALLHYASHGEANLDDAAGALTNVWEVVTADNRISAKEMQRLVGTATEVYMAMSRLHDHRAVVGLPEPVARRLEIEQWGDVLPERFDLGLPDAENMLDWLGAAGGWIDAYSGALAALRRETLDELLETEQRIATWFRDEEDDEEPPFPAIVPDRYDTLLVGQERPRQKKLDWWDRFHTADGFVPSVLRFAVAAAIVGMVMSLGGAVGTPTVVVYNGLDRRVEVTVGHEHVTIEPFDHRELELAASGPVAVEARTVDGVVIESFTPDADVSLGRYVYNVAAASPLVEWTASYGSAAEEEPRLLGAPRWTTTSVDHAFTEPPGSLSTSSSGATRTALAGGADRGLAALGMLDSDEERRRVALLQSRWSDLHSAHIGILIQTYAVGQEGFAEVLAARLEETPREVALLRLEQDTSDDATVCRRHETMAEANPGDADLLYLKARCIDDPELARAAFEAGLEAHRSNPWLAMAVGMHEARAQNYDRALLLLVNARKKELFLTYTMEQEARMRRLRAFERVVVDDLADLVGNVPVLDFHLEAEDPAADNRDAVERARFMMSAGQLDGAVAQCGDLPGCDRVLRFAAASDGAGESLVSHALALADEDAVGDDLVSAFALARKHARDDSALRAQLRERFGDAAANQLVAFADAEALRADPAGMEAKLIGLEPRSLGHAYVIGLVLLGESAPATWRGRARALLFADERPYFQPAP